MPAQCAEYGWAGFPEADRAYRRLKALDPDLPPLTEIWRQERAKFLQLSSRDVPDADDLRRSDAIVDVDNADRSQLEQALRASMHRKFAEQMDNGAEAHTSRMRRLAEAAPKRATQFRQAENLIRFRRAIDGDGPMKVGQQLRLWDFARAVADDPDGVRHMNRDMVLEMLAAIRGDGALGEMQNVRLNRGLAPGAPGRPFRVLMNGILAGARYAAEMDPAQIDQAQADILRIDPDRAETWHAVFDLMDRLRMDDNTRNTLQLKEVAEAVAHLAIGARAAEENAKPKPKPEPDDNTDNGDGDDGRKESGPDDYWREGGADPLSRFKDILPRPDLPSVFVDTTKSEKGTPEYEMLNNPAPNTRYVLDKGTVFVTNDHGYVDAISYQPVLNKQKRDSRQTKVGKEGLPDDVGGHIQACAMDGTCDRFNLFPQNAKFNNSEYRSWELQILKALREEGRTMGRVTTRLRRKDVASARPDILKIQYEMDGEMRRISFKNEEGAGKNGIRK